MSCCAVSRAVLCLQRGHPNLIQWVNNLQDKEGRYLPHLFDYAVDQTLHWANPGVSSREGCSHTSCM